MPARGPTDFGELMIARQSWIDLLIRYRLGRLLRVRGPDVRGDAQGGEEQDLASWKGAGEARRVVEAGGIDATESSHDHNLQPLAQKSSMQHE